MKKILIVVIVIIAAALSGYTIGGRRPVQPVATAEPVRVESEYLATRPVLTPPAVLTTPVMRTAQPLETEVAYP